MKTGTVKALLGAAALAALVAGASTTLSAKDKTVGSMTKDELNQAIHSYIMDNPSVIIEAVDKYQQQQQAKEQQDTLAAIEKHRAAMVEGEQDIAGDPNGDVTIIEFFDYNCGYCKRATSDLQKILADDKKVKVVFKELPILSESSEVAARWAVAAGRQGKYWEYHQALMGHNGGKDTATLEKFAKDLGLDIEKMRKDAESTEVRKRIEQSRGFANDLGINGTPAFIIGDVFAPGYMGVDAMKEAIAKQRGEGG